jgi:bile acid-coenzyme A ligase
MGRRLPTGTTHTEQLRDRASVAPDRRCLVSVAVDGTERSLATEDLLRASLRTGRLLRSRGVDSDSLVVIALPNGAEHVVVCYAAWWLGACVLPISARTPPWERDRLLDAAAASRRKMLFIGEAVPDHVSGLAVSDLDGATELPADALPVIVPIPGVAIPSGGSTGTPKIIVHHRPWVGTSAEGTTRAALMGKRRGQTVLVIGPMHHTGPFGSVFAAIFDGGAAVLMERFDPELALDLIERHRVNWVFTVPTHLLRMLRTDGIEHRDLSSLEGLYQSGAKCPPWLKRRWIELVGADRVFEGYGGTEQIGSLFIRGDEWLEHPGSVGRPILCDVRIIDPEGNELPPGEIGEIYLRHRGGGPTAAHGVPMRHTYWGANAPNVSDDGFATLGDLGWRDADGYVFIADRRVDMIVTGGVNVFPAEVEVALSEHPLVRDAAVVGLPDPEWGRRLHAIVEVDDPRDDLVSVLETHCRRLLAPPKVPKTYELVAALPRNEAGKIRRSELADARGSHSGRDDPRWTSGIS